MSGLSTASSSASSTRLSGTSSPRSMMDCAQQPQRAQHAGRVRAHSTRSAQGGPGQGAFVRCGVWWSWQGALLRTGGAGAQGLDTPGRRHGEPQTIVAACSSAPRARTPARRPHFATAASTNSKPGPILASAEPKIHAQHGMAWHAFPPPLAQKLRPPAAQNIPPQSITHQAHPPTHQAPPHPASPRPTPAHPAPPRPAPP